MATDADKQLALAYFPAFRDQDRAWWEAHIEPEFVCHDPALDFEVRGPAGVANLGEVLHGAFSDIEYPIVQVVAEGDRVLVHLRQTGRHTGEYQGTPATGREVDIVAMDLFRVANGKLVEHWAQMDNLGLLKQIGAAE